ncbi:hypothetical protein ACFL6S_37650, partial [Candidatus Poribacteria bacterium]
GEGDLMGYYTEIDFSLRVKKDKLPIFKNLLANLRKEAKDSHHWFWYWEHVLEVTDDGIITVTDCHGKFDKFEQLALFLAPYVEQGEIYGYGEDHDDVWRIKFDGKGNSRRETACYVYNLNEIRKRLCKAIKMIEDWNDYKRCGDVFKLLCDVKKGIDGDD